MVSHEWPNLIHGLHTHVHTFHIRKHVNISAYTFNTHEHIYTKMNCLIEFLWDRVSLSQGWPCLCLSSAESPLPRLAFLHGFLGSNLGVYACSINTLPSELSFQSLSLESLIAEFLIEGEKRFDSSLRFSDSLAFSSVSKMSEWNSSGFLSVWLCSSCDLVIVSSLNVALFFPLSCSAAAEVRIQLLSEPALTEFRVLDMGLSPCP